MNLSRASIHRPVFTIMVVLIVIILGGISFMRLSIDLMPDISYPTISVSVSYGNASPEEMEELVTRPLEEAVSAVPGVQEFSSNSTEGQSEVEVMFAWGTDLDAAANDIRDRMDRVIARLPEEATRPMLRKFSAASFPVLILGASADMEPMQLRKIVDDQVKYRIERTPGVAAMDVRGGLNREIHVRIYKDKVKALGLSLDAVLGRIRAENVNVPGGVIERGDLEVLVRTRGQYASIGELGETVLSLRGGVPVRLHEVADVEDSHQRLNRIVRINGKPGVQMSVNKQSGANTVDVAGAVLEEIARINEDIPQIKIAPIVDSSKYIKNSISNVSSSALYGGLLAVGILFIFLRSLRSTFIIATAIPVSIIATFALMYFSGFTLNIMTLGGLALGIGMLVDNAIVVLENIYRIRDSGKPALEAAESGSGEVGAAIVASTLTTVVVFLPLIFVRGMAGVMFTQLSYVIGFSLLCSLLMALTLVPALSARLLRGSGPGTTSEGAAGTARLSLLGRFFKAIENGYGDLLGFALRHRILVVTAALLVLGGSFFLVPFIGVELMPTADEGEVRINAEMEVGSRLEKIDEKFKAVEEIARNSVPEMESSVCSIGGGWGRMGSGANSASMRITLKPKAERARSSEEIAADLQKKLAFIPGVKIRVSAGGGMFILRMGMGGTDRLQIEIRGHDFATADRITQSVKKVVEGVEGVTYTTVSREAGSPEEWIVIDRKKAADLKLTVSQVANFVQTVLSGTGAGVFRESGDEYKILVQVKESEKLGLHDLMDLTVTNADGDTVALRNIADVQPQKGPERISRKNQERFVNISANISGRDMGSIIRDVREGLKSVPIPDDFSVVFSGDYEEQQKSFKELLLSLGLSLILVYMVMACQYESLRDPFVVMFTVPLAAIGVILMLFLTRTTFNIQSFIGCIMLGGIVVNNAILLVDHTNLLRQRDGMPLYAAIAEAGRRRLRPILMTALTTILGLTPLALGAGEGGEAQAPMARAVVGGLLSSTLITLVVVPVIYSLFHLRAGRKAGVVVDRGPQTE